jgi:hypothetical protein
MTKPVKINMGLCQGCRLSPVLFNTYINKIIELWNLNIKGIKISKK